jgi:hypothetical protein
MSAADNSPSSVSAAASKAVDEIIRRHRGAVFEIVARDSREFETLYDLLSIAWHIGALDGIDRCGRVVAEKV